MGADGHQQQLGAVQAALSQLICAWGLYSQESGPWACFPYGQLEQGATGGAKAPLLLSVPSCMPGGRVLGTDAAAGGNKKLVE